MRFNMYDNIIKLMENIFVNKLYGRNFIFTDFLNNVKYCCF